MNRQDWPVRPWSIGIVRLVEMRNDQPISKRSIILIGRSSCSRICRKARSVMPWSWSSYSHAEPPCCPSKDMHPTTWKKIIEGRRSCYRSTAVPCINFAPLGDYGSFTWSEGKSLMLAAWPKISSLWLTHEQISDLLIEAHQLLGSTYFFLGRFDEAQNPSAHRKIPG